MGWVEYEHGLGHLVTVTATCRVLRRCLQVGHLPSGGPPAFRRATCLQAGHLPSGGPPAVYSSGVVVTWSPAVLFGGTICVRLFGGMICVRSEPAPTY